MSEHRDRQTGFEAGTAAATAGDRPDFITDEHLEFLDVLRDSGVTNMLGARPYIQRAFPALKTEQAAGLLSYWMKTYGLPGR